MGRSLLLSPGQSFGGSLRTHQLQLMYHFTLRCEVPSCVEAAGEDTALAVSMHQQVQVALVGTGRRELRVEQGCPKRSAAGELVSRSSCLLIAERLSAKRIEKTAIRQYNVKTLGGRQVGLPEARIS